MDMYFFLQYFPLSINPFSYMFMNDIQAYMVAYIFIVDDENRHGYVILFNKIHTTIYFHRQHVLLTLSHGGNTGKK